MRAYYRDHMAKLETPEFVKWFESWYGTEEPYGQTDNDLSEQYWSERRFALMGWHAALLPSWVSGHKVPFVASLRIKMVR